MNLQKFTQLGFLCAFISFQSVAYAQVDIQTWQTAKGAKVMYAYAPELPMVDVLISFDAGSARDGNDWGLASFTASMLGAGTPQKDENEISAGFNKLGAQFSHSAGRDRATIQLRSLTRPEILNPTLDLMTEVTSQAVFPEAILSREKARLKIGLKQKSVSPSALNSDALWADLYGDHPYAHPVSGTLETLPKISVQKVLAFYQKFYVARNAQVSIVGAVDKKKAQEIAEKLTKLLPKGQKPLALPNPKALTKAKQKLIQFDSSQTYYKLAQIGVERGNPDYYALFLGNHLLGGSGFGSLLMEEVREKRGLVYGVSSGFIPMKVAGPFVVALSTKNATAKQADEVVRDTLTKFMTDFSDEQLEAIKSNLVGGFPLRIDSNAKIAGYISMIGYYDLPLNYLEVFPKKMAALTKQDILTAWKRHIQPEKLLSVMVGKPVL